MRIHRAPSFSLSTWSMLGLDASECAQPTNSSPSSSSSSFPLHARHAHTNQSRGLFMAAAGLKVPEMALRVCVVPLALASLWEMATNAQADDTYGDVKFSDLSGFSYLVGINAVTAAYAVASILLSSFKPLAARCDWVILIMDQVSAYLLVTSVAASAELLQLARHGDVEVSWGEVCSYFGRFCGKATLSLALHAAALACFVALSLVSAFRVFSSKFHPPGHGGVDGDTDADGQHNKHAQEQ